MRRSTRTSWQIIRTFSGMAVQHLPVKLNQAAGDALLTETLAGHSAKVIGRKIARAREHILDAVSEGGGVGGLNKDACIGRDHALRPTRAGSYHWCARGKRLHENHPECL